MRGHRSQHGIAKLAASGAMATGLLLMSPVPAQATTSNCVAVVVDSGPRVTGRCMTWRAGLTGAGALTGTGHSYRLSPSGLICAIDGFPADCHVDSTHYWSYWHKAPGSGSWTYSNEGAGTYNPRRGETEGWAYQNGTSRQPRNLSFSTICPPPPPAPAKPAPPPPPPPAGTGAATGGHSTAAPAPGRSDAAAAGPGTSAAAPSAPPSSAPAPPGRSAVRAEAQHRSGSPPGPVQPVVVTGLALVAAAGLGTAAWRRARWPR